MKTNLIHGDCLEYLPTILDGSVDACIADLPYGVLNKASEGGKWDCQVPLKPLWKELLRVVKPNGAIVLFSQGIFTAQLIMSQPRFFRYTLVWDKCRSSGFLNANRAPLRRHEDICVFYRRQPTYNPQKEDAGDRGKSHPRGNGVHKGTNRCYGKVGRPDDGGSKDKKFPSSILSFPRPHATGHHPTEKSVDLCRWLVRTYTNPGDTIMDCTMGSGTTGVAAALEDRRFIGIERDEKYFAVAQSRIGKAALTPRQGELPL